MNSRVMQVYEVYDFICSIRKKNFGDFDCEVHKLHGPTDSSMRFKFLLRDRFVEAWSYLIFLEGS